MLSLHVVAYCPMLPHPLQHHLQLMISDRAFFSCCLSGLWSLDSPSESGTAAVIQDAIQNPGRFVLKPQREGGGNNLYGEELVKTLQEGLEAGGKGLAAYILMQRIVPPPQRTVFVRNGAWMEEESLSELGIYGTYLRVNDKVGC